MTELKRFKDLEGETLSNIENKDNEELVFTLANGDKYKLYHDQDCCEYVGIEDIVGELDDLIGLPIVMAEEVVHEQINPSGVKIPQYQDSYTWTFYKLVTARGYATIKWYGDSNGYYSERVDFARC